MENILSIEFQNWKDGKISFSDLRSASKLSTRDLAFMLGIPMSQSIVAVRHAWQWWSYNDSANIREARKNYDDGTHEMVTGRVNDHFFLYAIPRNKPARPRRYFSLAGNGIEL